MRVPLLTVLLIALGAPPAQAATVRYMGGDCGGRDPVCSTVIVFAAELGERNDVVVTSTGALLEISDEGAPLEAGTGCRPDGDRRAVCDLRPVSEIVVYTADAEDRVRGALDKPLEVRLGEGEDRFAGSGDVDGGPGRDELRGARGSELFGGEGDDLVVGGDGGTSLSGGPGRDVLEGGSGDDRVDLGDGLPGAGGARPEPDRATGGGGRDELAYGASTTGVVVDLADDAPEGAPGEGDVAAGFEDVRGTAFADRLAGDEGPNRLDGLGGRDVLIGRGGDDVLETSAHYGEPADDVADGGAGADRIAGPGGSVRCGAGVDAVGPVLGILPLRARVDCEHVIAGDDRGAETRITPRRALHRGRFVVGVRCPRNVGEPRCRVAVQLESAGAGRRLGGGVVRVRPGRDQRLVVALDRRTRLAIRRPGGLSVRLSISLLHRPGSLPTRVLLTLGARRTAGSAAILAA